MTRLLLVGGGHAHVHVLDRLARERPGGLDVVLVAPSARQLYSGMLPGWIAGRHRLDDCALPLDHLASRAGARFVRRACVRLDPDARWIECDDGRRLGFDWLSLDVGAASAAGGIPGADAHAVPLRPLERFVAAIHGLVDDARAGRPVDTAIVGGGAAGVEIAFALKARLAAVGRPEVQVRVVGAAARPLDGLPRLLQWRGERLMHARGIEWIGGRRVAALTDAGVLGDDGRLVRADRAFVATGAAAHSWLAVAGLATDGDGFVRVAPTLQSLSHPHVFAAGDCATLAYRRPKSGVFAVRAGPPLAENLLRVARDMQPLPWRPQRFALYLVSTADGAALAAWGPFVAWGAWAGRWKDRIDRGFVARFAAPPAAGATAQDGQET